MDGGVAPLELALALGDRLQHARKAKGITQQELCERADLSYSTLAKIERGAIRAPSVFTVHRLAAVLDLPLGELLGEPQLPHVRQPKKRQSKSGVKFVFFDVNGCLVRFFQGAFTALSIESGAPADVIESTYWHYNDAVCRGDVTMDEFNRVMAERCGLPSVDWGRYYREALEPIAEMQELATWAAQYYQIGLLTNIMPGQLDMLMQSGVLPRLPYDSIIDSSVIGAVKPESDIYEIAARKAGVAPAEILLVDDTRANLIAAEHLGWHVMWFDDYRPSDSVERVRQALELAD